MGYAAPDPFRWSLSSELDALNSRVRTTESLYYRRLVVGQVYRTSAQTISNGVGTLITWQGVSDAVTGEEPWDAADPTKFTIPPNRGGYWQFSLAGEWEQVPANTLRLVTSIYRNSTASEANLIARHDISALASSINSYTMNVVYKCLTGDNILVELYQISGGNLRWGTPGAAGGNVAGMPYQSRFTGLYLGPSA